MICFAEGTASHIRDLVVYNIHAYNGTAWFVRVIWYSVVLFEPIVIWLALRARPAAVPLGIAIMVGDVPPWWYYNWSAFKADPASYVTYQGLLPVTAFGLFVVIAGVPLWRLLRQRARGAMAPESTDSSAS